MQKLLVTAADISLFHVAARELGDATQWWRIAEVNGLTDPDLGALSESMALNIPAIASDLVTGLPAEGVS